MAKARSKSAGTRIESDAFGPLEISCRPALGGTNRTVTT